MHPRIVLLRDRSTLTAGSHHILLKVCPRQRLLLTGLAGVGDRPAPSGAPSRAPEELWGRLCGAAGARGCPVTPVGTGKGTSIGYKAEGPTQVASGWQRKGASHKGPGAALHPIVFTDTRWPTAGVCGWGMQSLSSWLRPQGLPWLTQPHPGSLWPLRPLQSHRASTWPHVRAAPAVASVAGSRPTSPGGPTSSTAATFHMPCGAHRAPRSLPGFWELREAWWCPLSPSCHQTHASIMFIRQGHRRVAGFRMQSGTQSPLFSAFSFSPQDFIPAGETRTHV